MLSLNIDGSARLNYTMVCTLMLAKQTDICSCVDVELPPGGGSVPGLIAQLLGVTSLEATL